MDKEFVSEQFDEMYATGGTAGIYDLPYRQSGYYPLFRRVQRILQARGVSSVLEVGCGTGAFAHLLHDASPGMRYAGFDFSPVAVERACERFGRPERFAVGDARSPASYSTATDAIVCTEVLEHISEDLEVIGLWKPGTFCVCSVPNFDADNHVRFFRSVDEVRERYAGLIDIHSIAKVKKPFLSDLSWRNRLRALRWNRYRPARILTILGLRSFEKLGGWFVLQGTKRT